MAAMPKDLGNIEGKGTRGRALKEKNEKAENRAKGDSYVVCAEMPKRAGRNHDPFLQAAFIVGCSGRGLFLPL